MKTLTKYWFMEGFSLFQKLGKQSMMEICDLLEMEYMDKGCVIEIGKRDKKSIFFLKKGSVKIVHPADNTVKYIVNEGNIFGELTLYDEQMGAEEQAFTLEESIICYIKSDLMEELMANHDSLKNGILKVFGLRIMKLERRLQDLLYKDSPTRIREFITNYISEFGEVENDRLIAKNLLSHNDIAHLTNTSRQTVNNVLSQMRKNAVIDYNTQFISKPLNN